MCESKAQARVALTAGAGVVLIQAPSEGSLRPAGEDLLGKEGAGGRIALFTGSSADSADVDAAVEMAEELFGTPVTVEIG